jgi:hypothetical protein
MEAGVKNEPFPFSEARRQGVIHDRRVEHQKPYRWWAEPPNFEALEILTQDQETAAMLLRGLLNHYPRAVSDGRLHLWAAAAHSIIDLLADPLAAKHRRAALPPAETPDDRR